MLSNTEENYLKSIYHLSKEGKKDVATNSVAVDLDTSAASVTDMLKKLSAKKLVNYVPYRGAKLTKDGEKEALKLVRKHRLWETFLVQKLNFSWDEVHEVAEDLEHIKSENLIAQMDKYLGYPKVDPHGDVIPDKNGVIKKYARKKLSVAGARTIATIAAVDDDPTLLKYLDKIGATIGSKIEVMDRLEFDGSLEVSINDKKKVFISREVADNIFIV